MVTSERPPVNSLNRQARKVYNPLGFTRFYNFVLCSSHFSSSSKIPRLTVISGFIFSGALFGFILARASYLDFDGTFCAGKPSIGAAPGECVAYARGHYKVGIILHLATIIPASLLVLIQFLPFVRHRWTIVHRINGYIVILLVLATLAGALMIARVAFGGGFDTQAFVGFLAIIVTFSMAMGYTNIKRLQIDQHRKWMLRTWFYVSLMLSYTILSLTNLIPL
jgi:uncharacterized membrane protein